jgi:cytochrome c556
MKRQTAVFLAAMTVSPILAGALPARAQEGAIHYRQAVYQSIGGHMKAIVTILKGEVPYTQDIAAHAAGIKQMSMIVPRLFPEGSDFGLTRAKEDIWKNPDDFKQKIENFQQAAAALDAVAGGGDMGKTAEAVNALGKACKACHDKYRAEKE